jgi:AcrR family transcriptional regulator
MARARLHSLDDLLDVAEELVTHGDPAGLTLRALAAASGASNGTIYHAFHSKEELLARLWLRASARLGAVIEEAAASGADPVGLVVAAALAPAEFTRRHPASAQLFFAQRSDQLFTGDIDPDLVTALATERARFTRLLVDLAVGVWDRKDRAAVDAIAACVVDVPGGILKRALIERRDADDATARRIEAAVRAILALPLDPTH